MVHESLISITSRDQRLPSHGGNRFPKLTLKIEELVSGCVQPLIESCRCKVKDMIDFELAFINTEHPDFKDLKKDLLPLITKALGVTAPEVVTHKQTSQSLNHATTQKKATSPSLMSPMSQGSVNEESQPGGPFWKNWWGEEDGCTHNTQQAAPRRGASRRSSFSIMDTNELHAFRQSQLKEVKEQAPSSPTMTVSRCGERCEKKDTSVELVKEMIKAYFSIVARDITDKVPKAIMAVVVNHLKENLQTELITALYEDSTIVSLMSEPSEVSERRIELQQKIIALRKADALLSDTPSFSRPRTSVQRSSVLAPLRQSNKQSTPAFNIKAKAAEPKDKENEVVYKVIGSAL